MIINIIKRLVIISVLVLTGCIHNNEDNMTIKELIPRKILFGNPDRIMVRLSHDGKYISYVAPLEGVLNVYVAPSNDLDAARPVTFDKKRGVTSYFWTYGTDELIYSQDQDGDENYSLYHLNLSTMQVKRLTPPKVRAGIVNVSRTNPREILISTNERNPSYFDVQKLNLDTLEISLIFKNDKYDEFYADENNSIRFAIRSEADGSQVVEEFINGKAQTYKIIDFQDTTTTNLLGLNHAGDKLFLIDSKDRDTAALIEVDLKTGKQLLLGKNDKADISEVYSNPKTYEIEGYSYEFEKKVDVILDPQLKKDFDYLQKIEEGYISIASRTLKDDKWIVCFVKDNGPISYYLYDRKEAKFLFVNNNKLKSLKLNKMIPVTIKSRDNLEMVSYLSLPASFDLQTLQGKEPVPLILFVHGGPNARDGWGYNPTHQWLSNRGYAVLSVNYRGSTGFGKTFVRAGDGQWSGKMHDDLIDAVNWAIEKGITTHDKVGIFGGSYGGYATLVGLTMTPDMFKCGVDIVGPSNLNTLAQTVPPYWLPFKSYMKKMLGADWETEEGKKYLDKKSPLSYVDNISRPLLIAQGKNDPRVKQSESDQIVAKMKEKKLPVLYLLFPDEGHGFARPQNKTAFYAVMEQFLGKCFNMPTEEIGEDLKDSSMQILEGADLIELK